MAKIVIPISDNRLSNQFKDCGYYDVFEIDQKNVVSIARENHCKVSLRELESWVTKNGITDIITHKIDKSYVDYFSDTKVNLYVGVNIKSADQLISEYLEGSLKSDSQYITT